MGNVAAKMLLDEIGKKKDGYKPKTKRLKTELIIRKTT